MHHPTRIVRQALLAAVAFGLAACSAQANAPAPPPSTLDAARVAPSTLIPLVPGMSIGLNTFPDGDTATGGQGKKIDRLLDCRRHMTETFHIHVHLSIFDPSGTQIMVPWALGIVAPWTYNHAHNQILKGTCLYNVHTHDRSGVIHYEAPSDLGLTLGNVFDVWGEPLSTSNVAGYTGTVWVKIITPTISGPWTTTIDPRAIVLTEHQQINLAVGNPVNPVPKYRFTY